MFTFDYEISEYNGLPLYSSKACFTKDSEEEKLYFAEFVNIVNTEWDQQFKDIDEVVKATGFNLIDELTATLDNLSYGISGIVSDMWSCMAVSHCYRPNNKPSIRVEYDHFVLGFVHVYHLIKIIKLADESK